MTLREVARAFRIVMHFLQHGCASAYNKILLSLCLGVSAAAATCMAVMNQMMVYNHLVF